MTPTQRSKVERINILLRFAKEEIGHLDNGDLQELLDDLYFAIYAKKDRRPKADDLFHAVAKRTGLVAARKELAEWLSVLRAGGLAHFPISEHEMGLKGFDNGFQRILLPPGYPHGKDYPPELFGTMIYSTLAHLFETSQINPSDLHICPNHECERYFIPLRKPPKGKRAFCSTRCSHLVAVWEYRERKRDELKAQEKRRSKQRYRKKVLKK
jgi:hypothetical protein